MKNIVSYIISGVVGGTLVLVATQLWFNPLLEVIDNHPNGQWIQTNTDNRPTDFIAASATVTPAVVQIKAQTNNHTSSSQPRSFDFGNPFDMFDLDMGDFFGQDYFRGPKNGTGSGVIISEDGYIVTNNHVVGFADKITVTLPDKREYVATKIGTDPSTDLALIKIDARQLEFVEFDNSDELKVGEWVLAIGNPFSYLTSTVTAGIVSAKGRDIDILPQNNAIEEFIQTDAVINPGNSGGALVNTNGKLVGINTAIATPTGIYAGYSFAIPSNLVKRIIDDIKENGDIERGRLGILGLDVTPELVDTESLTVSNGFYVSELDASSSARLAGVLPGDVIIAANGKEVNNFNDLREVIEFKKVGDPIRLELVRNGKTEYITVKLSKGI